MNLRLLIVDHGSIDVRISSDKYEKVDDAVLEALFEWVGEHPDGDAPIFDSSEMFRGYIVINCDSGSTVDFLKLAVSRMDNLWSGAELTVLYRRYMLCSQCFKITFVRNKLTVGSIRRGSQRGGDREEDEEHQP